MHCEEPRASSTQVKHTAEELDEPDALVEFLEILNVDAEDEDQTYIMLDNGERYPEGVSRAGDLKEAQSLFDKKIFESVGRGKPDGRYIRIGMIRRWKHDAIKSRVCLQDVALVYTLGGELFAEWRVEQDEKGVGVIVGDVTQAIV